MSATPAVKATDLLVGYGESTDSAVCPPISFQLPAGRALAVVGANGTGKSTLLRAVAGVLAPLAGRVDVLGTEVDEREATFRAAVSTVMDEDASFPSLTVREHLLLLARGHGVMQASDLVTDLVAEFGLTDRERAMPTALSSGQRRRMLLAAAFVRPRKVLLLDEPEQRLDAGMRDRLAQRLNDERNDGVAIVMATHDPKLVGEVASHALVIKPDSVERTTPAQAVRAIEDL
ncbi:ABC transporter ATP-binding protein [Serinibacter salmoneus]|uniref:ABC-type multidrug transport system ATPase subunit n=1 Tax=Serinibacter salmoneus TaxID=556530 RepID=A0A2A9D192_9MICO|nr:ABC transporter ATP-binding protein [Serinibacter salmoneus]PFG20136.1 ABC-type multidrug transport system ATPase subunit [Serinibacter salmoneus]